MLARIFGGVRNAGALFIALLLGMWVVFGLAWFIAELIAIGLAGACVGYVVSHMLAAGRAKDGQIAALTAEVAHLKQLAVDAQAAGVYARGPVIQHEDGTTVQPAPSRGFSLLGRRG